MDKSQKTLQVINTLLLSVITVLLISLVFKEKPQIEAVEIKQKAGLISLSDRPPSLEIQGVNMMNKIIEEGGTIIDFEFTDDVIVILSKDSITTITKVEEN